MSAGQTHPPAAPRRRTSLGFTLVEGMVVVAVVGLLSALVAPNFSAFIAARQVEALARRYADDMALGRSEAIKRNASVLMCADASVTNGSCAAAPASLDWSRGWRLCYDANNDGVCDTGSSSDPNPIRTQPAMSSAVAMAGPTSRLRFNANGTVNSTSFANLEARSLAAATSKWVIRFGASGAVSVRKG
jgi:Tfp pilus assembly protein FimT